MASGLTVQRDASNGTTTISLVGVINEDAALEKVFEDLSGNVVFDLAEVKSVNSCGVREWVNALREFGDELDISYSRCSVPIIEQANMIQNFLGRGKVATFFAPYACPSCDTEHETLLKVAGDFEDTENIEAPEKPCPKCGEEMDFDDDEEEYFLFLEYQFKQG